MHAILMKLLPSIMGTLLELLPESVVQDGLDALFDTIEDRVAATDTEVDDLIVLPVIRRLRAALNVPDGDDA